MEIILKKPTEILSSPRNDGGTAVAAAKTVDGGVPLFVGIPQINLG